MRAAANARAAANGPEVSDVVGEPGDQPGQRHHGAHARL
eukprot:CAMPEP_0172601812 /NCGR_PEP_ID=MMETSP1068-20121228/21993_1 /TAXON_ID=35684 /ORGANISM="Pseudopedinella elastica, Strain CCMP716" /LENGTH=38 /DNA_ID= /DNA_START= /DNA_END= /DNA_ORIENTATION=